MDQWENIGKIKTENVPNVDFGMVKESEKRNESQGDNKKENNMEIYWRFHRRI